MGTDRQSERGDLQMTEKVRRWTSPNDANHRNHHAEVGGVEFFRFPYSPYMARVGKFTAIVSRAYTTGYYATVYRPDPAKVGGTIPVEHKADSEQDALFVWAAKTMKKLDAERGHNGTDHQAG